MASGTFQADGSYQANSKEPVAPVIDLNSACGRAAAASQQVPAETPAPVQPTSGE